MGRLAHAFLAARHHDGGVSGGDLLSAQRHGAKAGAAQLVDAPGRALDRHAGLDRRLARGALASARLQDLAHDHFLDIGRGDAGALDRGLDGDGAQFVGWQAGEGAVEGPDRGASGGNDDDVGHGGDLPDIRLGAP